MWTSRAARALACASLVVATLSSTDAASAAPPLNDDFADTFEIPALPFVTEVDASEATRERPEFGECSYGSHSVWYAYTATESTRLRLDVSGDNVEPIALASDGSEISCVIDGPVQPRVNMDAGDRIFIRLTFRGSGNPEGLWKLRVAAVERPGNDTIGGAAPTDGPGFVTQQTMDFATEGSEDPNCGPEDARTVWFSYVAQRSRTIEARVQRGGFTALYDLHLGAFVRKDGVLASKGCSRTYANLVPARVAVRLKAGEQVYFMVAVDKGRSAVDMTFALRPPKRAPVNDDIESAIEIMPRNRPELVDRVDPFWATASYEDPSASPHCPAPPEKTVWYRYTADQTESISVGASASEVSLALAYAGPPGPQTMIACDFGLGSTLWINLSAGDSFYLTPACCFEQGRLSVYASAATWRVAHNDSRATASRVPPIRRSQPFSQTVDAQSATSRRRDPVCHGPRSTLWYRYQADRTQDLNVSTSGSSYDTSLSVFRRSDMRRIACADDNARLGVASPDTQVGSVIAGERVAFHAVEGRSYLIQVGADGMPGILHFQVSPAR